MSKEMGVIALGIFVVIQPYLGIPNSWHTFLSVVAGVAIMVLGFLLRGEALSEGTRPHKHNSFVESGQPTHTPAPYENSHQEGITSLN